MSGRKSHQKILKYDKRRNRRHNRIEIMFGCPKNWRRVATRITPDAQRHAFPPPLRLRLSRSGCEA